MGKRLGVSGNYVYLIEKKDNQPSPSVMKLIELLEEANEGRLAGRRSILPGEDPRFPTEASMRKVPIISRAQAGEFGQWEELPPDQHDFLATDCPDPQAFALEIEGDSMEPKYEAGDLVVVMPNFKPTNESLVVTKLANGDVMFKRLVFLDSEGESFRLVSYNPLYPSRDVRVSDIERLFPVYSVVRKVWSQQKWQSQHNAIRGN